MLDFFRRYQWYFFLFITIMTVISFSFFGTYGSMSSNSWGEQLAFKAVDGTEVTRSDVDELALFLATDAEDKQFFGGAWGLNFLNDGVIRKDFLETGMAQELALAYKEDLQQSIDRRLDKEKKFTPYFHPEARFLSVENVWDYFAPQMKSHFEQLRASENGLDPASFDSRVKLYLAQKQLPPSTLRQVLRYQERQYSWLNPDPNLNQVDLSLFGYHTLEDWFGPDFSRLISEFIINTSILAEKQGYSVSKAEALSDLIRNTQQSYQQNLNNPLLGVRSPEEYFAEQLRRLNMDQARAVKVWRQVLLFRRYFQDAGATALVDNLTNRRVHEFANEKVTVDLYKLPEAFKIANFEDLQKFEVYLYAVAKQNKGDPLYLPTQFLALKDVEKKYPELVQKRYELEVAQASHNHLQARISLRELWNWELDDQNWAALTKKFPTLAVKEADNRDARFEVLDHLDATTRLIVDSFAKEAIVQEHPEWIDQALNSAKSEKIDIGLRVQGGKMPFAGLTEKEKRRDFINLLDNAELGAKVGLESPLYRFTADNKNYYRITVLNRAENPEILTFEEAQADGTLNDVLNRVVEKYYVTVRDQNPLLYQNENKEWKPLSAVKDLVVNQFFEKVIAALEPIQKDLVSDVEKASLSKDRSASFRFYEHLKGVKSNLETNPQQAEKWIKSNVALNDKSLNSLADQWKIEKKTVTFDRQNPNSSIHIDEALALSKDTWSALKVPSNGDLLFYQLRDRGVNVTEPKIFAKEIEQAQALLGAEAQRSLMLEVLHLLKAKDALSLAYLKVPHD